MERIPLDPGFDDGKVFRAVFAAYPDALLLVDLKGTVVLANPAAVELLGYAGAELIGLPVEALVPDAVRPRHAAYRNAYSQAPRTRPMGTQMDLVARRRDGSEVRVEIALSPLLEEGLPYVVAAIRGVDAYPRVQQALKRARHAESLAHFGRMAVDAAEPNTLLPLVPGIVAQALQIETAAVLMLEPSGLAFRIAAATGLPAGMSVGQAVPDAQAWWGTGALAVPLSDRGRTVGTLGAWARPEAGFGEDEARFLGALASLLTTVLQREKSEEALRHSQRLESVGQLTGGIAHDFNNLLTVISGNLQVLEDTPAFATDPLVQQLVGAAARAARRGADLTGKLLAFSRRQVLQPTVVDTRALLESLTDMLRRTLDQRIEIRLDAVDALCLADPVQLESALLNIAINARDAMPDGGTLGFVCRVVSALPAELAELADPLDPAHGRAPAAAPDYVAISVADTGVGMPEAVKEHAFEPFFTTKEAGRGTGLGLSTVYGFARQSQGAVGIQSTPGAGTTLTLYLPRVDEEVFGDEADASLPVALSQGLRVLLVEDDVEVRAVLQRFLLAMGCQTVLCADAEQALPVLASQRPLDLLLTDIALGAGMRGNMLAARAVALRPALAVLLMSGFASGLLDAPQNWPLLRKPCTRAELESAMAKALLAASL